MHRREKLVFPGNPAWRLRIHPTSPLFNRVCATHGSSCPESSSLLQALHHVQDSWTADDRAAHPPWAHDLVDLCGPHQCDDLCRLFQGHKITIHQTLKPTVSDEIAYLHGSKKWDAPWESPPSVSLDPTLAHLLDAQQTILVKTHLQDIKIAYDAMENAGFFAQTAAFLKAACVSCGHPTSAFGAGFSGFDRRDERGWDRAGYQPTGDHSTTAWELRTTYQIAYFVALGRIFQIPAGHLAAYDPCYSIVDVVLLATLGVRAFRRGDPGLKALRTFRTPTLFYAPGAEQVIFKDAIARIESISNLIILGGDASWCEDGVDAFTANYRSVPVPAYNMAIGGDDCEAPCGEDNRLQWVPRPKVAAFDAARGPAREPSVRHIAMPDGSFEPDD
ncbi:hypothetical protein FB45DRAFT_914988 [Roridomyces roridus]|uniref:SRR1-like domain-containing protein n=1 Tax=Roridomyces roridus TaxID=1738132 RepID=A0AAD7BT40_9AGAR|nr:hypothetical protein FB45DRAFT_914988 [Roridomyces roridus]